MESHTLNIELNGKTITLETGKIARQANASIMLHTGETTILTTVCAAKEAQEETDFLPLRVDYQEKFSSVGKTAGGFIKREGKPSTKEILTSRLIDRSLRPLFDDGYFNEVQLLSYVYSYDSLSCLEPLAICAASAALAISDIPFNKPIGAVRVGLINDAFVINPNTEEQKKSKLDLVLAGTENAILMIEGSCEFLTEEQILNAIDTGHKSIREICGIIINWQKKIGKEKNNQALYRVPQEANKEIESVSAKLIKEALTIKDKQTRENKFAEIKKILQERFFKEGQESKFTQKDINIGYKNLSSSLMRKMVLNDKKRIDGRSTTEIRPISIETGILGRTHGSSLFTRGETQALAVCTLGGENMAQRYEDLHGEGAHRFYLQYFFPPFSVGEVGRPGMPGRREIGHGKLAERALVYSLPMQEEFPYIIRLESNITESNGSSSMASVCGGCLSLMDAGVPIKRPVSGIAMGLILEESNFVILSDILGSEDALGDMDFKITGDETGITAFQMDIKVEGITLEIMRAALHQAKEGRVEILKKMLAICPKSKEQMSIYVPKIITLKIKQSKIGELIGPGGKQIRSIIEQTQVEIDISDDGVVSITSTNPENLQKAKAIVLNLTSEAEVGKVYKGKITSIKPFGLFVQIFSKEGLCHISEISYSKINNLEDLYKEGDDLEVKVLDINDRGQIKLSHKALLKKPS